VSLLQPDKRKETIRKALVASLPRLQRFADLLAGNRAEGRTLLRRSLIGMLSERLADEADARTDRWAFAEIYRSWLEERHAQPPAPRKPRGSHAGFERLFNDGERGEIDTLTVRFLWKLPVPERSALLLTYGEKFDPESAAMVLVTTAEEVEALLIRANAMLADRVCGLGSAASNGMRARRSGDGRGLR
jgi:DNA-directed RNA polymerase specialized sigma24 family protein